MYYNEVKYGKFHVRRNFARTKHRLALPNLIENQIDSFNWFVTDGLKDLLSNLVIQNPSQTLELYFGDFSFGEPECSILECKQREISYTRPLRCMVKFRNGEIGDVKDESVLLCAFPWMTPTGTFIINGAERVIVNQIVRSSGVLFKEEVDNKTLTSNLIGQVIPTRGSWIEYEMGSKNYLYAKVDRSKKIYLPIFLKSIGFKDHDAIRNLFGSEIDYLNITLEKDTTKDCYEALRELYSKIKQGDEIPAEGVISYLESHLMDTRRYELMGVGRYKFNKKLDFVERAVGHRLAKEYKLYVNENGERVKKSFKKGTEIDEELARILDDNREVFRKKVDLEFVLRDETDLNNDVIVEEIQVIAKQKNEEDKVVNIIGSYFDEEKNHVTISDIIAATSYYLNLIENVGNFDDVDNLANRRLRLTGELIANQVRVGLAKLEKSVKDKMSTKDVKEMTIQGLVNAKPLESCVKDFFGSSQLSQFMSQTNPLDEITNKRRLSALGPGGITRDRAGIEVRDVHPTHYGRICPIETPEGQNIGLISSLASYAKVNSFGFIQTPYFKVVDGKVTDEYEYMTADEEALHYIAEANTELNDDSTFAHEKVYARHNQETNLYEREIVDYMDVSPKQIVSISAACIPFLEHDDANRTLMGSNMQRQSIPLLKPEAPYVGTGIEYSAAHDSGVACICKAPGVVTYIDGERIKVRENETGIEAEYVLNKFLRSNQGTCINQKPICEIGEIVEAGDILADGPSMDKGELALGRNVLIGFMTWEGYNYEDAIVMNENLVKNDIYTSIHIEKYELQARDTKLGKEEITREIPNSSEESRKNLDADGLVIPGSVVKEEDYLVGKVTPKGQVEPTPYQHLLDAILGEKAKDVKDSSLKVPHGGGGIVQAIRHYKRPKDKDLPVGVNEVVRVYIVQKRKIRVGDKMSGRHGNKGVISNILPQEDMPFLADGTALDILLNPQGVPSRMNIGQVLEVHLGMACRKLSIKAQEELKRERFEKGEKAPTQEELDAVKVLSATEVFDCCRDDDLNDMMAEAGMTPDGKVDVFDGRTGEKFDNPVNVGVMYMIKLDHMVDDKMHARSVGPYVLVTQQPLGGKAQNGGQRFGEMEVWALEAYGAAYTLQEMLTVKSDDILGRNRVSRAISEGKEIPEPNLPESFRVFTRELRSLGIYVELIDKATGKNVVDNSLVDEDSDNFIQKYHF